MSEKVPLSSDEEVRPGQVQYTAASPRQAEAVYIHNVSSIKHSQYHRKLSIILGFLLIILQTIAICLNIGGVIVQNERGGSPFSVQGNYAFLFFGSVWCGIFVYISAALAIASGKVKGRGLIIAHLVLACFACVFSFMCGILACGGVVYEARYTEDERSSTDKASLAIAVLWLVVCWVIVILVTWCAVLCCKILCCGRDRVITETEIVTPIHAPQETLLDDTQPTDKDKGPPPYGK